MHSTKERNQRYCPVPELTTGYTLIDEKIYPAKVLDLKTARARNVTIRYAPYGGDKEIALSRQQAAYVVTLIITTDIPRNHQEGWHWTMMPHAYLPKDKRRKYFDSQNTSKKFRKRLQSCTDQTFAEKLYDRVAETLLTDSFFKLR